jgi:FKBP-type peptidyl-prolyl cis-trans isomerase
MNMIRIPQVLIGLLLIVTACKKTEKETPNGLRYTVLKSGDGVTAKPEEVVVFNFVMKDSKDSIWADTYDMGMPQWMLIGDSAQQKNEDKLTQLFYYLSKGDSVLVSFPVSTFFRDYAHAPVPEGIDTTMSISYTFNVVEFQKKETFGEYRQKLMDAKSKNQVAKDDKLITTYLKDKNLKAEKDSTGLYYTMHSSSGGTKPTSENCVEVKYKGTFLKTGATFDQNERIAFPLSNVIRGWQIGIPKLGIGDSATFYIPSGLAYGPQGMRGGIPPDAVLVFDVKLHAVGASFDEQTRSCK